MTSMMRAVMATVMAAYIFVEKCTLCCFFDRSLLWSHYHRVCVFLCCIVFIAWPLLIIHTGECKHDRQRSSDTHTHTLDSVMCRGVVVLGWQADSITTTTTSTTHTQNRCKFIFCMFCCRLFLVPIIDLKVEREGERESPTEEITLCLTIRKPV